MEQQAQMVGQQEMYFRVGCKSMYVEHTQQNLVFTLQGTLFTCDPAIGQDHQRKAIKMQSQNEHVGPPVQFH